MKLSVAPNAMYNGILQGTTDLIGGQLKFPATQVPSADANTLDDYEEKGTWTPVIEGSTIAGAGTYTFQVGRYTKIGNAVVASAYIGISAHTGTGQIRFSGLPFTPLNVTDLYQGVAIGQVTNLTLSASNYLQIYIIPNSTIMVAAQTPVGGGASAQVSMDTAFEVIFTATYLSE